MNKLKIVVLLVMSSFLTVHASAQCGPLSTPTVT
ncbi:MAG: hypothetical protein ACI9J3_002946, partial [Parvicellaceae bacterium]